MRLIIIGSKKSARDDLKRLYVIGLSVVNGHHIVLTLNNLSTI